MIDERALSSIRKIVNLNKYRIKSVSINEYSHLVDILLEDINSNVEKLTYSKIDISKCRAVDSFKLNKLYNYTTEILDELNSTYDLNLKLSDILVEEIKSMNFKLKMSPNSTCYFGSIDVIMSNPTLDIIAMLDDNTEVHVDLNEFSNDAKYLTRHLEFDYIADELSELKTSDNLSKELADKILLRLTDFIRLPELRAKNIYGCIVESNGESELMTKEQDSVVKLMLNKKYCTSHVGCIELYYNKPR